MESTKRTAPTMPPAAPPRHAPEHAGVAGNGAPEGSNGHEEIDLNVPKPRAAWVGTAGVLAVLLITGLLPRQRDAKELNASAGEARNAPVLVNAVKPRRGPTTTEISLPGTMRPWQEVSIFARTTGYLKKYNVDISNNVEKGALMAEIESPEVDQQLEQAKAALTQMNAAVNKAATDRDLAHVTWTRFKSLEATKGVSEQDLDEKKAALAAAGAALEQAKANAAAADANVQQLMEMKKFQKVIAPFSGVVTGRAYDVGSLILANPTNIDIKPMFKIAENDVLRAFVNVPQSAALQIRKGMDVKITVRERPGRTFMGKVMGTTNYLDPGSRSLLTEVKVTNTKEPGGEFSILPGMYIQAGFTIVRDTPPLMIPGPALINSAQGTQVAVVRDGVAHFQTVTLGQDFGNEVEVVGGLTGDEQLIANPGERIVEGAAVSTGAGAAGGAKGP